MGDKVQNEKAEDVASRFMAKLEGKEFTMARSSNTADDYTETRQERDSKAVKDFVETDLFQDILKLK
jgi:hypothetical protein